MKRPWNVFHKNHYRLADCKCQGCIACRQICIHLCSIFLHKVIFLDVCGSISEEIILNSYHSENGPFTRINVSTLVRKHLYHFMSLRIHYTHLKLSLSSTWFVNLTVSDQYICSEECDKFYCVGQINNLTWAYIILHMLPCIVIVLHSL